MRRTRFALAMLGLAALAPAAQADEVAIRAAAHDGYGRLAFDWPVPVTYEARVDGETLTIRFARALQGEPDLLRRGLAEYIASAKLEDDGKTLVARLKRPVTVNGFTVKGTTVVLDLAPVVVHKPAPPAPPPAPAAVPKPAPAKVQLSSGEKNGTTRITFDWPRRVEFGFAEKDSKARLTFRAAGEIDEASLSAMLAEFSPKVETARDATTVTLSVPAGAHLRFVPRLGKSVLLDVKRPPAPPAPPAPVQAAVPVAPAIAAAAPEPAPAPDNEEPPPLPQPPASLAVKFTATDNGGLLRFDWPVATGAAMFKRGGALWIVFAAPTALDLSEPLARGQAIAQIPMKDATVLRLATPAGLEPSVRRAGSAWIVELKPQQSPADAPIFVEPRPNAVPAAVAFRVHQANKPVRLADEDLGTVLVVPVGELGRGLTARSDFVDFSALPSLQGIVLRPHVDDLAVAVADEAVEVTRPGGLELSNDKDRLLGHRPKTAHALFDFQSWRAPRGVDYTARRAALERAITLAAPAARSEARLAMAQFYFANFFAAETLAVLEALARDTPALLAEAPVHALKGAACLLVVDLKCASDELGHHALDGEPEAVLWRASLASMTGDQEAAAKGFLDSVSLLPTYPRRLRSRFALEAANAMLETGRQTLAAPLIDLVLRERTAPPEKAMALYLDGLRLQQAGRLDDALQRWSEAAAMKVAPSRARALYARAMALAGAGIVNRPDTIRALDALRFAWRGDGFEFTLLRSLGELRLADGDEAGALQALHAAATEFPDIAASKDVVKETSDAFAALFLSDKGSDLPALKALALYDQFHDVEPVGERRDKIVKRLIDRLVAVDLLDRAASLIEEQVTKRLAGDEKARGATQLALLRLMDHEPDAAMKALDIEVGRDLAPDLARQRQQLRARALLELNRPADAIALIANDESRDADRLRADIHWRAHDWKEAAKTLGRLAGAPPAGNKLDPDTARIVVGLAAALTLADDPVALAKLRSGFGPAMAASRFGDAFRVLAGDGGNAPPGDPRQVAKQVAQIGDLQSFMSSYRDKLASSAKPAAIN